MLEERNQDTSKVFVDGRQKLHNIRNNCHNTKKWIINEQDNKLGEVSHLEDA